MSQECPPGDRSSHEAAVIRTMTDYDMVESPDEPYYASQYLHWILPELSCRFPDRRVEILDLGCGQGRLSIPLGRWCATGRGRVTGVDLTPSAVDKARARAATQGLSNVAFHQGDALGFARGLPEASANAVLLLEVTFFLPGYRDLLREMARLVRPGGLMFVSFRSQYYNLLQTVWSWRLDGAEMALREREGYLWGEPVWYTWQTPEDIGGLFQDLGLRLLCLRGIGVCSGLEEDPHGTIIRPSQLPPEDQERLMAIECAAAEAYAACGRYILAWAEKPTG